MPDNTYASEQAVVEGVLNAGWPALNLGPIQWPGQQYSRPASSGNAAAPATYIAYASRYKSVEQCTFDGDEQVDGWLRFGCWVESETGEESAPFQAVLMDALHTLFIGSSASPVVQPIGGVLWVRPPAPGASTVEGTWYGKAFEFPFIRFRNP